MSHTQNTRLAQIAQNQGMNPITQSLGQRPARTIVTISFFALSFFMTGCSMEKDEDRKIASALSCLDTAKNSTDSDSCQAKVDGMDSQQASLIRCSANLIAQGVTGSRLASAFSQLNKTPGTGTQTSQMLSFLVFAKNLPLNTADLTYTNCTKSGVQSVSGLASMIQAATTVASLAGTLDGSNLDPSSPSFNSAQLTTLANTLYSDNSASATEKKSTIGQVALTAQSSLCGTGSSLNNQDVCKRLNSAITSGNGNAAQIGQALLNQLLNP